MILDTIALSTKKRVANAKNIVSEIDIKRQALKMPRGDFCFETALREPNISFICEIKKASPSKGIISEDFPYIQIANDYQAAGASAISVLTEPEFFLGNNRYLSEISRQIKIPLLRKDFTIDEYQIYEAKVIGANCILLICSLLDTKTICDYINICDSLGICALVEAHTEKEVHSAVNAGAKIIGVNNRNLNDFKVDIKTCAKLTPFIPKGTLFVAESGIKTFEDIAFLRGVGVDAVLIGETLMRSNDKAAMLKNLKGENSFGEN